MPPGTATVRISKPGYLSAQRDSVAVVVDGIVPLCPR